MRDGVGSWKTYGVRGGASERDESARGPGQSPARSDCMCCKVRGSRGGGKGKGEICGRRQLWRNGRETSKWQGSLQRQGQALAAAAAAAGPWKLWSCWYGTVTVQYARLSCLQRYLSFWPFHSPADGNPAQGKAEAPMPCLRPALDWWDVRWTWTSTLTLRGDPQGKAHDFASHRATRPHRSPSPHTTPPPLPPDEWGLVPAGGARGRYRVLQGFALPPESRFQRRQIPCAATSPVLTRYRSPKTLFINLTPSCSPSRSTSTLLQPRRASARSDAGDADVHFDMDMAVAVCRGPLRLCPSATGRLDRMRAFVGCAHTLNWTGRWQRSGRPGEQQRRLGQRDQRLASISRSGKAGIPLARSGRPSTKTGDGRTSTQPIRVKVGRKFKCYRS